MNVAVLFDSVEDGEVRADALLVGKRLYSRSLKVFYLHPCIDHIVMVWHGSENVMDVERHIKNWKVEYGIDKPVRICRGKEELRKAMELENDGRGRRDVELYVLHDIRYPLVTADMIYRVAEKAALYGVAVTAEEIRDDLVVWKEQRALDVGKFRYAKYPVAVRAGDGEPEDVIGVMGDRILEKCIECKPFLCRQENKNPFVSTWNEARIAEADLQVSNKCNFWNERKS